MPDVTLPEETNLCPTCKGTGREKYIAGPWAINSECGACRGTGKAP